MLELPPRPAKFPLGATVRVKLGTMDPDFPDIPLGGWAGTIHEIDQQALPPNYLVKWNQNTLDQMNPVYCKRCERDDLELGTMWLAEDDLELDTGEPGKIDQPLALVTRPLSQNEQDDRIRAIFGLTSDDPLPWVTDENLHRYHRYLATHLSFPFQAKYRTETEPFLEEECPVTIIGLLDPEDSDEAGLLVEAEQDGEAIELPVADIEGTINAHHAQLIEDYAYWFINWEDEGTSVSEVLPKLPFGIPSSLPKKRPLFKVAVVLVLWGATCGVVVGSLLASMEIARILAGFGATVLGFFGLVAGSRFGMVFGTLNQIRSGRFWGSILGAIVGAMVGAILGAMAVAFVGLLAGGLLGAIVGEWVLRRKTRAVFLGSMAGATVQAFVVDQEQALIGATLGGAIGAGAGIVLYIGLRILIARNRGR